MGRIGPTEILIIIAIALLLFGGKRIAEIGKGLGEGIKNFKKGINEVGKDGSKPAELPPGSEDDKPAATAASEPARVNKSA